MTIISFEFAAAITMRTKVRPEGCEAKRDLGKRKLFFSLFQAFVPRKKVILF
jgi:hypothetical protein